MDSSSRKLRRFQLDRTFSVSAYPKEGPPSKGWIHEIRNALGMSMQDLAFRLGVIKQRIDRIEKDEVKGKVTLETMQKTAEALGCDFVYYLVPKTSLQNHLEQRAHEVARELVLGTNQSMALEKQTLSGESVKILLEEMKEKLLAEERNLWKSK